MYPPNTFRLLVGYGLVVTWDKNKSSFNKLFHYNFILHDFKRFWLDRIFFYIILWKYDTFSWILEFCVFQNAQTWCQDCSDHKQWIWIYRCELMQKHYYNVFIYVHLPSEVVVAAKQNLWIEGWLFLCHIMWGIDYYLIQKKQNKLIYAVIS